MKETKIFYAKEYHGRASAGQMKKVIDIFIGYTFRGLGLPSAMRPLTAKQNNKILCTFNESRVYTGAQAAAETS
jgi:hypothetical protein